jgi:CheY-like chemotaxis protein
VVADAGQLEQVIVELALNARDATPPGGRLTLRTGNLELDEAAAARLPEAEPGAYVLLEVEDTGCGMDAATLAHIFEPFFTTKEPGKGTGLGLATVFGIVRQSGGHIWAESEPGRGATFRLAFPARAERAEAPQTRIRPWGAEAGPRTVLLVEDDDAVRRVVEETLRIAGVEVLVARRGEEALTLADGYAGPIHLLVADVVLPGISGPELLGRLADSRSGLKALYLSGYPREAVARYGLLEPGAPLLQKPFSGEALTRKVYQILEGEDRERCLVGAAD